MPLLQDIDTKICGDKLSERCPNSTSIPEVSNNRKT
jgi:hypothetical protein